METQRKYEILRITLGIICIVLILLMFNYIRTNVEYIKLDPCGYCQNKTKSFCYTSNQGFNNNKDINYSELNLLYGDKK